MYKSIHKINQEGVFIMAKKLVAIMITMVLAVSFSALVHPQDNGKKNDDKMTMTKEEKIAGPLKSITCDPGCGFMIQSRDEKEVLSVTRSHAKKVHHMDLTEKKAREMMKTVETTGGK
jgi:predicted small metal-binding protein